MIALPILLLEDDIAIAQLLQAVLQTQGFECIHYTHGDHASRYLQAAERLPALIVLDWMLPDISGVMWLKNLRTQASTRHLPVLMLTARSTEEDKVYGLEAGADDYLTKPFSPRELTARIQALLRRHQREFDQSELCFGNVVLDKQRACVRIGEKTQSLSPIESKLLHVLLSYPRQVFSREQLLMRVWQSSTQVEERTVDVNMARLRKLLAGSTVSISTVRGLGYCVDLKP